MVLEKEARIFCQIKCTVYAKLIPTTQSAVSLFYVMKVKFKLK
jgi:hypothetical protein